MKNPTKKKLCLNRAFEHSFGQGSWNANEPIFNPLTLMGNQDRSSPNNINTISIRQVIRIKENIN